MECLWLRGTCTGSQLWHLLCERPLAGHLARLSLTYKTGMIRTLTERSKLRSFTSSTAHTVSAQTTVAVMTTDACSFTAS